MNKYFSSLAFIIFQVFLIHLAFADFSAEKQDIISKDKTIPIVFAINEEMSLPLRVAIQSITEHASADYFYEIFILYTDLSDRTKNNLEKLSVPNIRIKTIPVNQYITKRELPLDPKLSHVTHETYYRLLIPELFTYDKVIYLDADLVVRTDIAKLYQVDLVDNLIAGVADVLTDEEERVRRLWSLDPLKHINAGVLLINNKLWREEKIGEKCFNETTNPKRLYTLNDQDIINVVCRDRILLLDPRWNFLYAAAYWQEDKYVLRQGDIKPSESYILHFNGWKKPWIDWDEVFAIWWHYANNSPFYQKPKNDVSQ